MKKSHIALLSVFGLAAAVFGVLPQVAQRQETAAAAESLRLLQGTPPKSDSAGADALWLMAYDIPDAAERRRIMEKLGNHLPKNEALPAELREHGWSQRHVNIGVGLMGLNWVGAALAGLRSGGRSAWFQNALATWTLHGFGHLGLCLLRRGYVSGAATAPLVIGHGVWALRVLREEGVPRRVSAAGMAATLPVLVAAHAGAEVVVRLLSRADAAGEPAGADSPAGSSEADGSNGSDGLADAARDEGSR